MATLAPCRDSGLKISEVARKAHNRNAEYCANDAWNKAHRAGTYYERSKLASLSTRMAKAQLSRADVDWGVLVREI